MNTGNRLTAIIAEDDTMYRIACVSVMQKISENINIIEAKNGAEAIEVLKKVSVDILVTDLVMKPVGGIELVAEAKKIKPDIKTMLTSSHLTYDNICIAKSLGINVLVYKTNCQKSDFEDGFKAILENKEYYSPNITDVLIANNKPVVELQLHHLAVDFIKLLNEYKESKEIAIIYKMSKSTVDKIIKRTRDAFKVQTNQQLVDVAKKLKLI